MEDQILAFIMANPTLVIVVFGLQMARLVFKPLCSVAQTYVDSTVDTADNEILVKIQKNFAFRAFGYLLDWSVSIKLPQKKAAVEVVVAK